jgi:hypothetical protein
VFIFFWFLWRTKNWKNHVFLNFFNTSVGTEGKKWSFKPVKNTSLHKTTPSTALERLHKVFVWWAGCRECPSSKQSSTVQYSSGVVQARYGVGDVVPIVTVSVVATSWFTTFKKRFLTIRFKGYFSMIQCFSMQSWDYFVKGFCFNSVVIFLFFSKCWWLLSKAFRREIPYFSTKLKLFCKAFLR